MLKFGHGSLPHHRRLTIVTEPRSACHHQNSETIPRTVIPSTRTATITIITMLRSENQGFFSMNLGDFLKRLFDLRGMSSGEVN
jgi:hypothetical protein